MNKRSERKGIEREGIEGLGNGDMRHRQRLRETRRWRDGEKKRETDRDTDTHGIPFLALSQLSD